MTARAVQAQEEVSAALHAMGVDHKVAPTSDGGVLKPDLAIISPSGRIALSVNGASDFCANSPYQPQGDAILGWRLLMLYDWKVGVSWRNLRYRPHATAFCLAAQSCQHKTAMVWLCTGKWLENIR